LQQQRDERQKVLQVIQLTVVLVSNANLLTLPFSDGVPEPLREIVPVYHSIIKSLSGSRKKWLVNERQQVTLLAFVL